MSDPIKTILFISVMILCVIGAVLSLPSLGELEEGDPTGQTLFPEFTDPLAVASVSITKYDGENVTHLKTRLEKGMWRISSHGNYPADALQQVSEAATLLSGMKILGLAGSESGRQGEYGVVDPTQKNLGLGIKGVGTRVVLKDGKGTTLADLIIGKPDPHTPDLCYVRRTGEPMILTVKMKDNTFTTKFSDWAKKNPLDINILALRKITFDDYRWYADHKAPFREGRMLVQYDPKSEEGKWKLENAWLFMDGRFPNEFQPGQGQSLDAEFLDRMKATLENLTIVDVACKSPELSKMFEGGVLPLKKWKEFQNQKKPSRSSQKEYKRYEEVKKVYKAIGEIYKGMEQFGFHITKNTPDAVPLYGEGGQVSVLLDEGVKYTLRFGNIVPRNRMVAGENPKGSPKDKSTKIPAKDRYLLITVDFDQEGIAPPDLEDLPALPMEGTSIPISESQIKEIKAARERIERENEWKKQEYEAKVTAGKKRAEEINARFAGWYYVIPEDVYKKLHLSIDKFFKDSNQVKVKQP